LTARKADGRAARQTVVSDSHIGRAAMDWRSFIAETNGQLGALRPQMPETAAGFGALAKAATRAGALDMKTKELMALAMGIGARCDACLGYHAKALVKLGATRAEVVETIEVAIYMGGGPSLMYGGKALEAFDAFSAQG
jgi:AhpD family alkylhydroperoxidase